jgi:hypothetical protein
MADNFDKTRGALDGLPNSSRCEPSVMRVVPTLGVGAVELHIVETIRTEEGDYVFLEHVSGERTTRIVLPPKVTDAIARQRASLVTKSRKRGARQAVAAALRYARVLLRDGIGARIWIERTA